MAQLLGFPTWAAYILDIRMAKTVDSVKSFLEGLLQKLTEACDKDLDKLKALKAKDVGAASPTDVTIHAWDYRYLILRCFVSCSLPSPHAQCLFLVLLRVSLCPPSLSLYTTLVLRLS